MNTKMSYYEAFHLIQLLLRNSCRTDVAVGANISVGTYDRWASGMIFQPRLATFVKLCLYFGINVDIRDLKELL